MKPKADPRSRPSTQDGTGGALAAGSEEAPAYARTEDGELIMFEPDDPLVLNGTYDVCGWKPGERARSEKAKAKRLAEQARCDHRWNSDGFCPVCFAVREK